MTFLPDTLNLTFFRTLFNLTFFQGIVAEGYPEDVALLEDISIDLTLDKDPSFACIVLIEFFNNSAAILDFEHIAMHCGLSRVILLF